MAERDEEEGTARVRIELPSAGQVIGLGFGIAWRLWLWVSIGSVLLGILGVGFVKLFVLPSPAPTGGGGACAYDYSESGTVWGTWDDKGRCVGPPGAKRATIPQAPAPAREPPTKLACGRSPADCWKLEVVARLERYKRYPAEAKSRREKGAAQLSFVVDRGGTVRDARILRSSGSPALDFETLQLVERATASQPLPPPPPEIIGAQIPIVVPVAYR
jgi:protein TonB